MSPNIAREVAALNRMTVTELRARHIEVFGEATRSGNKDWLRKRIARRPGPPRLQKPPLHGGRARRRLRLRRPTLPELVSHRPRHHRRLNCQFKRQSRLGRSLSVASSYTVMDTSP